MSIQISDAEFNAELTAHKLAVAAIVAAKPVKSPRPQLRFGLKGGTLEFCNGPREIIVTSSGAHIVEISL